MKAIFATVALGAALLAGYVYLSIKDDRRWESFSAQHKCRVVRHGVRTDLVFIGKATVPRDTETTIYQCDDGVEYTR